MFEINSEDSSSVLIRILEWQMNVPVCRWVKIESWRVSG